MKLYSRQLNSVKELKAEKLLLQKQLKVLEDLSLNNLMEDGLKELNAFGKKGLIGVFTSLFKTKKISLLDELIGLATFVMNAFTNEGAEQEKSKEQIPDEIWDSYLKWKAMSWVFTMVAGLFKKKKKNN